MMDTLYNNKKGNSGYEFTYFYDFKIMFNQIKIVKLHEKEEKLRKLKAFL